MHASKASPRRHIVHAVIVHIVTFIAIVVLLLHKVIVHIVAVPIERFVGIVLMNLQTLYDIVAFHFIRAQE